MERGHVKLWRKSIDSGLIQSPNLWAFWSWCLLKATWKNRSVVMNMQTINLLPGQLVFGRKAASKELNMSEQTIRTCLEKLKKLKNITIQSTSHYSIISVVNWDNYQGCQPTDNHLINQPPTSRQPAANHKQEVKEIKEGKEKDLLSDSPESDQKEKIDDEIVYFVTGFQNAVAENHGAKAPRITDSLIKNGSSCIDKLIRLDGFEKEEVFNAIRWAYKDSFWSNQVFSMASLRTKGKNGLMKFQNIMNSMQIRPQSITGSPRTDQNIRAAMEFINDGR